MSVPLSWIRGITVTERPKERVQYVVLYVQAFTSSTFYNSTLESRAPHSSTQSQPGSILILLFLCVLTSFALTFKWISAVHQEPPCRC